MNRLFDSILPWGKALCWAVLVALLALGVAQAAGDDALSRISPVGMVQVEGELPIEMPVAVEEEVVEPMAAPRPTRADYPNIGVSSRAIVWVLAQLHLFFAALVLAVPLFVLTIELLGVFTGDERYDSMAH